MTISEFAKLKTGIEIHPAAQIGDNFVIDHGIGTVIGETTRISRNCYILQSVILGSVVSLNTELIIDILKLVIMLKLVLLVKY